MPRLVHPPSVREYAAGAEMIAAYSAVHRKFAAPVLPVRYAPSIVPRVVVPVVATPIEPDANEHVWAYRRHLRGPIRVSIATIQHVVAAEYGTDRAALLSTWRYAKIVRPRQVAIYLAREMTKRSLPEIGRRFGGRDHTTVLHAVRKIGALIDTDPAVRAEVTSLRTRLSSGAAA